MNPWPVAITLLDGAPFRIWYALPTHIKSTAKPGTIVLVEDQTFSVATDDFILQILAVQLPGKKQVRTEEFLQGYGHFLIPGKTVLK